MRYRLHPVFLYLYKMKRLLLLMHICWGALTAQSSLNMQLIYSWTDTNIIQVPMFSQRFNDIWGYEQNGREYAIIGSTMGIHFFDITDTTILDYVDFVPGKAQGDQIIHRDFKNFNNYLYAVCDEGPSSMQIIDMQYLPDSVHVVYDSDAMVRRAHNVFIDANTEKLYVFGPRSPLFTGGPAVGYPMMIFSLANPVNPAFLDTFSHNIITYVHDGYINNDTALLNCGYDGLYYGYFGDTQNPVEIDHLPFYLDQGYNHSGWITADKQHYIMSDETHGMRMKMLDLQPGMSLLSTCELFGSEVNSFSIPHNQLVKGNYAYVSYYFDGVRVFDISDPCNTNVAAYYDTYPGDAIDGDYAGAWGVYPFLSSGKILVSDMQTGLYVLRLHDENFSVNNVGTFSFGISPNPTSDIIQFNETFEFVKLLNVKGQLLQQYVNTQQLNLEWLTPGIYFLGVEKEGSWSYQKFMKQ